jgi:hypothetical protein
MNLKPFFINLVLANAALLFGASMQSAASYLPSALSMATFLTAFQSYLVAMMLATDAVAYAGAEWAAYRRKRDA